MKQDRDKNVPLFFYGYGLLCFNLLEDLHFTFNFVNKQYRIEYFPCIISLTFGV